jgi:hypothetical protein
MTQRIDQMEARKGDVELLRQKVITKASELPSVPRSDRITEGASSSASPHPVGRATEAYLAHKAQKVRNAAEAQEDLVSKIASLPEVQLASGAEATTGGSGREPSGKRTTAAEKMRELKAQKEAQQHAEAPVDVVREPSRGGSDREPSGKRTTAAEKMRELKAQKEAQQHAEAPVDVVREPSRGGSDREPSGKRTTAAEKMRELKAQKEARKASQPIAEGSRTSARCGSSTNSPSSSKFRKKSCELRTNMVRTRESGRLSESDEISSAVGNTTTRAGERTVDEIKDELMAKQMKTGIDATRMKTSPSETLAGQPNLDTLVEDTHLDA